MSQTTPIPLQSFLQLLTSRKVSIARAMKIAGQVYKQCNTPEQLGRLTNASLLGFGVSEKEDRDAILNAVNKAGYRAQAVAKSKEQAAKKRKAAETKIGTRTSLSRHGRPEATTVDDSLKMVQETDFAIDLPKPFPRKRRKLDDTKLKNEFLPDKSWDEGDALNSFDFEETLAEEALADQYAIVNRAPIMMAWSCIVAERIGFAREEALSIASVYTEMNAITRGLSLGIYDKTSAEVVEASPHGTQPYAEVMGRRIPLYKTSEGSWRALNKDSKPASPATAFSYISRSLKQNTSEIVGSLRLLAQSHTAEHINRVGWSLYAEFRPEANGWGKRGRVDCDVILGLRPRSGAEEARPAVGMSSENAAKPQEDETALPSTVDGEDVDLSEIDLFGDFAIEEPDAQPDPVTVTERSRCTAKT
ncbi:unnamed protein product [Peniophora sp. CBMAI 1063]|nr:unnamed protein product [Peniophora sp. CBMAI 1063]